TDGEALVGHYGRQPVDGGAGAVEAATDHLARHTEPGDVLDQADGGAGQVDARGLLEHLEHRVLLGDLDDLATALATVAVDDLDDGVVAQVWCVLQEQQRAGDVTDLAVLLLE